MIRTENLSYTYEDGTAALTDINFDSSKGEIVAVIGANGCGKSSFFSNLVGLLKPQKGKILFNGKELKYGKKELTEYRTKVNLVFQNPDRQIFFSDIYDDLAFPLRNLGFGEDEIKKRVETAVSAVGAETFYRKPIHFLSYGQKKRIAIAGILVLDTEILLMDEPTSGLDPLCTEQIKNIILNLRGKKRIIISSHDMDLIYGIADYIYVFNKGRIIGEGNKSIFLNEDILREASLKTPWLVKIHKKLKQPLFQSEEEFDLS